jgi:hypothetical protein
MNSGNLGNRGRRNLKVYKDNGGGTIREEEEELAQLDRSPDFKTPEIIINDEAS